MVAPAVMALRRRITGNKRASATTPLHENLREKAGKGVLTGEVIDVAEEDGVDRGNFTTVGEGAPKSVPELHKGT
jgi:hypothetical protein